MLPPCVTEAAVLPRAPTVWDETPDKISIEAKESDKAATQTAFASPSRGAPEHRHSARYRVLWNRAPLWPNMTATSIATPFTGEAAASSAIRLN